MARAKEVTDGAEPAGNSVAAENLVYLAKQLDKADYREKARRTIQAPAAIWAAWRLGWPQWRPASGVAMLLLAALLLTLRPADWSRRPWSRDYFDVAAPTIEEPSRTLVLMVGNEPGGYLVPYLPASLRFLRIDGYFTGPSPQPNESDRAMQRAVRGHRGPVLFLFRSYERPRAVRAAAAYGLRISTTDCRAWLPGIEPDQRHPFELCGEDLPAS